MKLSCEGLRALARQWSDSPDGGMPEELKNAAREHLASCDGCAARYGGLPALFDGPTAAAFEDSGSTSAFADSVMRAVRREALAERESGGSRNGWQRAFATAAAIALVFASGFFAGGLWKSAQPIEAAGGGGGNGYVEVRFTLNAPAASSVELIGLFPEYPGDDKTAMARDANGLWYVKLRLRKDTVYTYSFSVDGREAMPDPAAEEFVEDGFGGRDSLIRL